MDTIPKTFRCRGCGDIFELHAGQRRPTFCGECRRIKHLVTVQRYKKKRRKIEGMRAENMTGAMRAENMTGASDFLATVGGAQLAEIARALGIDFREVHRLERQALTKVRANPEFKNIWVMLKEELAEGATFGAGGTVTPEQRGNLLLDHQQSVAEWWRVHDEILEQGCTEEAMECLNEILRFQKKIADAIASGHHI
jgi:hypothetical protein